MTEPSNPIPTELRSGDTARWSRSFPDYSPADGWSLKYALVGSTGIIAIDAEPAAGGFAVNVAAATTAGWEPGLYTLQEFVTKADDRFTLGTARIRILPNLAAATVGVDTRTHAQKVLALIEAWLESKAPTAGAVEVAGRKIQNYPIGDLLALRDRYRAEVNAEEAAANGHRGRRLLVRI